MKESKIQKDICDLLLFHPKVVWAMVVTTGVFKVKGGYITTGQYFVDDQERKTGISDIIGQLIDGRIFTIEVKQPGETPTDEQMDFTNLVSTHNGVAGWCDSIEGAKAIIDNTAPDKAL